MTEYMAVTSGGRHFKTLFEKPRARQHRIVIQRLAANDAIPQAVLYVGEFFNEYFILFIV
ncbi:hypothetical protein VCV18_006076 [Metarhizium anisopliae]